MNEERMEQRLERRLQERLLLQPMEGDRLVLDDATLRAALDGSRRLTAAELAALHASPLTLRRFRHLALARRNAAWQASGGMLRAADSGAALAQLVTDDGNWSLHFVAQDGGWQVILRLDPAAPFAAALLRESPLLRVADGAGATVMQGRLDADGECEAPWPFALAPAGHFQAHGAAFSVRREP
ncbi:hypothetical protein ACFFTM_14500 [Pseudoduganella plicata]|uniref:Uncharacterized protein n=1 Tax=Pseudoduganella plicata TaxID=321984 RepID=A0A4P7BAQ8_9BURK|nr:hypothetical protein [Pseudoduganella plicata]QBQ34877.1 hypothetical protein E1742_00760 [Pseudoduganella plicata]GGY89263.1 hypothetical protein GCM10007388_23430 [Pseudoduganella plicata]